MFLNWIQLTRDAAMLAIETQRVMGLRMIKLNAGGPAAHAETLRMITEKGAALSEATLTLARGGSPNKVIRRYRAHVRANNRRLSKADTLSIR